MPEKQADDAFFRPPADYHEMHLLPAREWE
jgi:hypothetical protein